MTELAALDFRTLTLRTLAFRTLVFRTLVFRTLFFRTTFRTGLIVTVLLCVQIRCPGVTVVGTYVYVVVREWPRVVFKGEPGVGQIFSQAMWVLVCRLLPAHYKLQRACMHCMWVRNRYYYSMPHLLWSTPSIHLWSSTHTLGYKGCTAHFGPENLVLLF